MKNNRITRAFAEIKTEDCLKESTMAFLETKMNRKRGFFAKRLAVGFACALLLFFGGLFSYQSYFTVTAYVDIDVNPSMELAINRYGRVIAASAYNDDGAKLLARVSVKNKECKEALRLLIDEMYKEGYVDNAELFSLTLQTEEESQKKLLGELDTILSSLVTERSRGIERDVFAVDSFTKTASHDHHLSPAKYLAIQELQAVDPTATFQSCSGHTISEIREQTQACISGGHDEPDSNGHKPEHEPEHQDDDAASEDEHDSGGHETEREPGHKSDDAASEDEHDSDKHNSPSPSSPPTHSGGRHEGGKGHGNEGHD